MKLFETKNLLVRSFAVIAISVVIYSCNCVKCLVTPPPLNAYASDLTATNHLIDSTLSEEWLERYKDNKDSICNNIANGEDSILSNGESFNKEHILKILCIKGCIGLRIRYGMDSLFKVHQIINGIDQYGNDLFYKYKSGDAIPYGNTIPPPDGTNLRLERGMCPPDCD